VEVDARGRECFSTENDGDGWSWYVDMLIPNFSLLCLMNILVCFCPAPGSSHGPQTELWDRNELEIDGDTIDPDELTYEELTTLGEVAGTVATGLTAEQMEKMPRKLYQDIQPLEDPCVVCQINFEECDSTIELPCKHIYHAECILQWLEQKKTCPQCGQEAN
jgi:hypothetical protein